MKPDRLISFASVHHAIRAERLLTDAAIKVMALPTPREISISCGQCLLFKADCQEEALAILQKAGVHWSKLFSRDVSGKVYEKLADYKGEP